MNPVTAPPEPLETIRRFYNENTAGEWARIAGRPEFLLTTRFLDRYIHPGDSVLDIGGGPGRYSLYLAARGCRVTLLDLSPGNLAFARQQAGQQGLPLATVEGDARHAHRLVHGPFDHVLLMGPLYHLQQEASRVQAVKAALALLRPNGFLYASFISLVSAVIHAMAYEPACILREDESGYLRHFLANESFAGTTFTQSFFIAQKEVLPFMARFPLKKRHLLGQEGMASPCEKNLLAQPPAVLAAWLDLLEAVCEREELLGWAEHFLYIGQKTG